MENNLVSHLPSFIMMIGFFIYAYNFLFHLKRRFNDSSGENSYLTEKENKNIKIAVRIIFLGFFLFIAMAVFRKYT